MREEDIIKEYENKLTYAWSKANTKSKKRRLLYDLSSFSVLSSLYPEIAKKYNWENNSDFLNLFEDVTIPLLDNIMEMKHIFMPCASNIINAFKEVDFPFYKDYRKEDRCLSQKDSEELMYSFLNEYNKDMLVKYKELIKEGKIFDNNPLQSSALFCSLDNLKESFIYPITNLRDGVYKSSLMSHELGHYYEALLFQEVGNISYRIKSDKLPFGEVASRSFEYAYLRYLLDNNILTEDVKVTLRRYYRNLLVCAYDMGIIYRLKDIKLNENNYIMIDDPRIVSYGNSIMNYLNYDILYIEKGDIYDFRESFIYGIGNLFAIHLYEFYKDNPNNYWKEFRNMILALPNTKGIEVFENVGITKDKLISCNTIKKELKRTK